MSIPDEPTREGDFVRYIDRQGNDIGLREWADKFEDNEYRLVRQTPVGDARVRTVWIGVLSPSSFPWSTGVTFDGATWFTRHECDSEESALEVHDRLVEVIRVSGIG